MLKYTGDINNHLYFFINLDIQLKDIQII